MLGKSERSTRADQRYAKNRKEVFYSFALMAVSVFVALLIGEVTLRLLGHHVVLMSNLTNVYAVDDPVLNWRYVAGSESMEGKIVYRYNRAGFRDIEHAVGKAPDVKRIVVVGDSVTEGQGVEWEGVFAALLQSHLGAEAEVINIAQAGLNTPQEVHLFEQRGLMYEPDLVILNFVLNDCHFYSKLHKGGPPEDRLIRFLGLNIKINPTLKRALKSSALVYFVNERVHELAGRLPGVEQSARDYYASIWADEQNRQKVEDGFNKLADLHRRGQFEVLVFIWPLVADYESYRYTYIHEWVKNQAEKRGLLTLDLLPHFSAVPYRKLQVISGDYIHPNARGHRIAADAFLAWYRSR